MIGGDHLPLNGSIEFADYDWLAIFTLKSYTLETHSKSAMHHLINFPTTECYLMCARATTKIETSQRILLRLFGGLWPNYECYVFVEIQIVFLFGVYLNTPLIVEGKKSKSLHPTYHSTQIVFM